MSQKKVLEYKEEKRNRKDTIKKKKRKSLLTNLAAGAAVIAVAVIIGFVVYNYANSSGKGTDANTVNVDSINSYVGNLKMDEAMAPLNSEDGDASKDQAPDMTEKPNQ